MNEYVLSLLLGAGMVLLGTALVVFVVRETRAGVYLRAVGWILCVLGMIFIVIGPIVLTAK